MAQAAAGVRQEVNQLLDELEYQWGRLPTVAAEIDTWEWIDQAVFIEEWPLEEDRLARLEGYAAADQLSPEQRAGYEALVRLIAQNRPVLRQLQEW